MGAPVCPLRRGEGPRPVSSTPHVLYVQLRGELDLAAEPVMDELRSRTAQLRPARIVIDMSSVSFLDCAGYGFLLAFTRETEASGTKVSFKNPSRAVTRLTSLLPPSAPRLDEARAASA